MHRYLHRRVANDEVAADDITLSQRANYEAIGIAAGDVILHHVVVRGQVRVGGIAQQANTEVSSLRCVSVSDEPIRTEPAAAGAAEQSYAATGKSAVPIANGNIVDQMMIGAAAHENARATIRGQGYIFHRNAHAVIHEHARAPKLANQTRAANGDVG